MAEEESNSLEYTPSWVVAVVCFVIVLLSLLAERSLHKMGKFLMRKDNKQEALYQALQKLKEELMLLGFISLLLTVFQGAISKICIPPHLANIMLPCKRESTHGSAEHQFLFGYKGRHLLASPSAATHCSKGKVPMLSLEALHQLHIFIFVMAIVQVIFCVSTLLLGGARIRQWKKWEDSIKHSLQHQPKPHSEHHQYHHRFVEKHAKGFWKKAAVISWLISFFKQFYHSITESDYIVLRQGFIKTHFPNEPDYDFHKHMMQTVEKDIKKIVGISWYLWLFVVIFLLLNVGGWHTYFWMAFLPLILLLLVGAKLEHIIKRLALEVDKRNQDGETAQVEPSDKHFWFHYPPLVLHLIHFILFQNAFEIAFFFWIWSTYGFGSCIMEKLDYVVPRLVMGVVVQVLCSYSTLPLYALVSQMGSSFKFDPEVHERLIDWSSGRKRSDKLAVESFRSVEHEMVDIESTPAQLSSVSRAMQMPPQLST